MADLFFRLRRIMVRYKFLRDESGHTYLVPVEEEEGFYKFVDGEEEYYDYYWSMALPFSLSRYTFENVKIETGKKGIEEHI